MLFQLQHCLGFSLPFIVNIIHAVHYRNDLSWGHFPLTALVLAISLTVTAEISAAFQPSLSKNIQML